MDNIPRILLRTGFLFGSGITLINLFNIRKSPVLKQPDRNQSNDLSSLKTISIGKGIIYGTFYPIAIYCMWVSLLNDEIHKHLVPGHMMNNTINEHKRIHDYFGRC